MKIIAHRGVHTNAPENSLAAIQAALAAKIDGIETDLRTTADGAAVLSHDSYFLSENSLKLPVREHTLTKLRKLVPALTTLPDAAAATHGHTTLYLEIKPGEPTVPIIKTLRALLAAQSSPSDFVISSFDFRILQTLHKALPQVPLMVLDRWSGVRASSRARRLGTTLIGMNARWLWRGFLRAMQRSGFRLIPYTVNSPAVARKWEPYIEGIFTDYPARFADR